MRTTKEFEYPDNLKNAFAKAKKIEWISIGFSVSSMVIMFFLLGSSQAMKSAWLEDVLVLVSPVSFLVANRIYYKQPNREHPYGFHGIVSILFLTTAVALASLGIYLFIDGISTLIRAERVTIGNFTLFGVEIWLGYAMLAALIYSAVPSVILGRKKLPLAKRLHDKILFTDAKTNKADWMTAVAAMIGVVGLGFEIWWLDPVAAILISIDIIYDGMSHTKTAVLDLMDRIPKTVDDEETDPLMTELETYFNHLEWVDRAEIRLREEGHIYFGEVFLIPKPDTADLVTKIHAAHEYAVGLHWKIFDVVIMPVISFEAGRTHD